MFASESHTSLHRFYSSIVQLKVFSRIRHALVAAAIVTVTAVDMSAVTTVAVNISAATASNWSSSINQPARSPRSQTKIAFQATHPLTLKAN